jgi:hypothetical protein
VTARRTRLAVALVGILAIVAAIAVAGSRPERRQLASNLVPENEFPAVVPAGARACQAEPAVPGGTGTLQLLVGTYGAPGPPLEVTVTRAGRAITAGRVAAGWREGHVLVPVRPVDGDRLDVRVCVRNGGRGRIALGGKLSAPGVAARVAGAPAPGQFRIAYETAGPESWWTYARTLPARVASVRDAVPGRATFAVWILLLVAVAGGAVALIARGDGGDA